MRKEGLLYPTCLTIVLGWGVFFASYEYLAGRAERTVERSRMILSSVPALPGELGSKEDELLDIRLLEHRRRQTASELAEAEHTIRLATMASAVIAAAAGVFIFALAKPRREKHTKPAE